MRRVLRKELVDHDRAESSCESDVVLGRELLIDEEQHAVLEERLPELVFLDVRETRQIDAPHQSATSAGISVDFHRLEPITQRRKAACGRAFCVTQLL